mmetsp:Transcript_18174/g.37013  ORF Transcript_18174/g.37013 Transcript_18174/m.37013 type:complete len:122 (-) Transcript_18174:218-583(-)|eukprot:CAMPEP_0119060820 /NCGR_PEP_ID=MMETSP1178-20130426/4727_1 /TAXON_ID=33656 /ORGANISM="unid sp, Strain CCMP2000" /LENGTH=121 /DNA_ID=CAMNT_0007041959 /DNA_START=21 /DNA_END=386 /DNA_ORIENTATION=-
MRSVQLVVLLLAAARAGDPPSCKWSWKSLGCTPKDACRLKPRLGTWCVAKAASEETTCDEPMKAAGSAADEPAAKPESADAKAAPLADAAAEEPPSAEPAEEPPSTELAEDETADEEEASI